MFIYNVYKVVRAWLFIFNYYFYEVALEADCFLKCLQVLSKFVHSEIPTSDEEETSLSRYMESPIAAVDGEFGIVGTLAGGYKAGSAFNVCVITYDDEVYVMFQTFYMDRFNGRYRPGNPGLLINESQWNRLRDELPKIRQLLLNNENATGYNLDLGSMLFRTTANEHGTAILEGNKKYPYNSPSSRVRFTYNSLFELSKNVWEINLVVAQKRRFCRSGTNYYGNHC